MNVNGSTSRWLKVVVGEDSISAASLSFKATLTSPPGTNFDLFIYTNKGGGCGIPAKSSTSLTGADAVYYSQPDIIFGGDDDYLVLIEVRNVTGDCTNAAKWKLKLEGNY